MEKQPTIRGRRLELLISEEEIKRRIKELAEEIERSFPPEGELLIVGLLKGSFIFVSDLVREIKRPVLIDFISASSYSGTESSGNVEIRQGLDIDIKDKNVLLVDDILDTGRTFKKVLELLHTREPKSLKTCVLLDKPSRRVEKIDADFVGFKIPDKFVVGYGLDWDELGRNLKGIYGVRFD
ncbi:MAG TPA: hypoxanthine phosphoribosyltransferase [Aquifex aeolicus]|nr:hypoxanthine phosphoribosyltransferase [Aquifex sp.]HIQ26732.1 hypoxanthine phosphoribosyltransferase [Aquifex aeolicus]